MLESVSDLGLGLVTTQSELIAPSIELFFDSPDCFELRVNFPLLEDDIEDDSCEFTVVEERWRVRFDEVLSRGAELKVPLEVVVVVVVVVVEEDARWPSFDSFCGPPAFSLCTIPFLSFALRTSVARSGLLADPCDRKTERRLVCMSPSSAS